jgi:DNA replication factor GINS
LYQDLYRAWKNEKTSQIPQPLPQDFYRRAESYLQGLEDDPSDSRTLQGQLNQKEREVANRLFHELKEARIRKLMTAARDGSEINTADLTEDEKKLVKSLSESLTATHATKTNKVDVAPVETDRTTMSVVRFLQDIPEIVGTDLKIYGPYKKEDVGSLPSQNAEALMKQGAAKMIEVRKMPQEPPRKL